MEDALNWIRSGKPDGGHDDLSSDFRKVDSMLPTKKGQTRMAFDALDVALEINRLVAPLARDIALHDPDMARQIRKAAQSITANLAEGRKRIGRDRLHLFRIADGSAAEVKVTLDVAEAWGFIGAAALAEPLALLDRELAMTWRLTHR